MKQTLLIQEMLVHMPLVHVDLDFFWRLRMFMEFFDANFCDTSHVWATIIKQDHKSCEWIYISLLHYVYG
jgi:hypothetical protein